MGDMEKMGVDKIIEMVLEMVWDGVDMVYMFFDIDSIDCGFVFGIGWLELGGFFLCEVLVFVLGIVVEGICGFELVEVLLFYDILDIIVFMGICVIVDVFGVLVFNGKMGVYKKFIDKLVFLFYGEFSGNCWVNDVLYKVGL